MPIPPLVTAFKYADGPNVDSFQRLRVSSPNVIFETQQQYSYHPLLWNHITTGTGSAVHNSNTASTRISTGSADDGAKALRRSKIWERYVPGLSMLIKTTFVMNATGATFTGGAKARVGFYSNGDGIYLQQSAAGLAFVLRTKTSGVVTETVVPQSQWNMDPLNGTGVSKITLDTTKIQILIIDLQWLGGGRVRVGFSIAGEFYFAHQFSFANQINTVYMRSANLPVSYEVVNEGSGADITMDAICVSIEVEAAEDPESPGYFFSFSTGNTPVGAVVGSEKPVLSYRLTTLFNGREYNGHIHASSFSLYSDTGPVIVRTYMGGSLTGASFVSVSPFSGLEYDSSATAINSGVVIGSAYCQQGATLIEVHGDTRRNIINRDANGDSDIITVTIQALSAPTNVYLAINYKEQY